MHRDDDSARKPDAGVRCEVERLVGDAHMDRLVRAKAGAGQCVSHAARRGVESLEARARKRLARGEALRRLGEERSEIQARREMEKVGGWRSD